MFAKRKQWSQNRRRQQYLQNPRATHSRGFPTETRRKKGIFLMNPQKVLEVQVKRIWKQILKFPKQKPAEMLFRNQDEGGPSKKYIKYLIHVLGPIKCCRKTKKKFQDFQQFVKLLTLSPCQYGARRNVFRLNENLSLHENALRCGKKPGFGDKITKLASSAVVFLRSANHFFFFGFHNPISS